VVRTRDPNILDTCHIVVDVGAVYDESKQRFDHHQRGFDEVFGHGFTTKLSSAGLVYRSGFFIFVTVASSLTTLSDISVAKSSRISYS
jgi:uncharacterized UPF0160 family protein